jgi:hypothetical protein
MHILPNTSAQTFDVENMNESLMTVSLSVSLYLAGVSVWCVYVL